eukprot:GDKJ01020029.1.p1 GENE.GDKJ01020029.1~~GDKJ01020029.1.p1  ORF type:complete len:1064 (+),score=324.86 GDKJ01020029.1:224-3193(+)
MNIDIDAIEQLNDCEPSGTSVTARFGEDVPQNQGRAIDSISTILSEFASFVPNDADARSAACRSHYKSPGSRTPIHSSSAGNLHYNRSLKSAKSTTLDALIRAQLDSLSNYPNIFNLLLRSSTFHSSQFSPYRLKLNLMVAGRAQSGKTELINALFPSPDWFDARPPLKDACGVSRLFRSRETDVIEIEVYEVASLKLAKTVCELRLAEAWHLMQSPPSLPPPPHFRVASPSLAVSHPSSCDLFAGISPSSSSSFHLNNNGNNILSQHLRINTSTSASHLLANANNNNSNNLSHGVLTVNNFAHPHRSQAEDFEDPLNDTHAASAYSSCPPLTAPPANLKHDALLANNLHQNPPSLTDPRRNVVVPTLVASPPHFGDETPNRYSTKSEVGSPASSVASPALLSQFPFLFVSEDSAAASLASNTLNSNNFNNSSKQIRYQNHHNATKVSNATTQQHSIPLYQNNNANNHSNNNNNNNASPAIHACLFLLPPPSAYVNNQYHNNNNNNANNTHQPFSSENIRLMHAKEENASHLLPPPLISLSSSNSNNRPGEENSFNKRYRHQLVHKNDNSNRDDQDDDRAKNQFLNSYFENFNNAKDMMIKQHHAQAAVASPVPSTAAPVSPCVSSSLESLQTPGILRVSPRVSSSSSATVSPRVSSVSSPSLFSTSFSSLNTLTVEDKEEFEILIEMNELVNVIPLLCKADLYECSAHLDTRRSLLQKHIRLSTQSNSAQNLTISENNTNNNQRTQQDGSHNQQVTINDVPSIFSQVPSHCNSIHQKKFVNSDSSANNNRHCDQLPVSSPIPPCFADWPALPFFQKLVRVSPQKVATISPSISQWSRLATLSRLPKFAASRLLAPPAQSPGPSEPSKVLQQLLSLPIAISSKPPPTPSETATSTSQICGVSSMTILDTPPSTALFLRRLLIDLGAAHLITRTALLHVHAFREKVLSAQIIDSSRTAVTATAVTSAAVGFVVAILASKLASIFTSSSAR